MIKVHMVDIGEFCIGPMCKEKKSKNRLGSMVSDQRDWATLVKINVNQSILDPMQEKEY